MAFESGKPQWHTIARTEVKYFDIQGNPVELQKAVRVITTEYDEKGTIICTRLSIDFKKANTEM
ncbi:MAG: hypothetical protein P4N59_12005 [Negativicutes bacterium]|nr:hypothetical protein [Negativicutes bacterium]